MTTRQPHMEEHGVEAETTGIGWGQGVAGQPITLLCMHVIFHGFATSSVHLSLVLVTMQTWVGPMLLCINPFEAPGPAVHAVLKQLCEQILREMASDQQPRALIFK